MTGQDIGTIGLVRFGWSNVVDLEVFFCKLFHWFLLNRKVLCKYFKICISTIYFVINIVSSAKLYVMMRTSEKLVHGKTSVL